MNIIERLKGTLFEGCVTKDDDGFYFRYDTDDNDPDEAWDEYCDTVELLRDYNLVLVDSQSEHDCITGSLFDSDWLALNKAVHQIEKERQLNKTKGEL